MKKYFLLAIGVLLLFFAVAPHAAHAAITFDASSTLQIKKNTTTATSTITIGAGSNEITMVCLSVASGKTVSSVTVGGSAATKILEKVQGVAQTASLWYFKGATSGAKTISSTLSAAATTTIGASSYFGVDQTNPIDANSSGTAASGSSATSSITTLNANDWVVDCESNASGATLTAGTGQTIVSKLVSVAPLEGSSYRTSTTPQNTSTSWTLASSQAWALSQAALRPSGITPDATAISTTTGNDGAKSSDSITITGTNFGTAAVGSRATCNGGPGTGCIQFVVGGNDTVPTGNVTAWTDTSITFTVPATLNSNGGASAVQVYAVNASDTTPLTFYVYPRISSVIGVNTNAARVYNVVDTDGLIRIVGDHFGTTTSTATIIGSSGTLHYSTGGACTTAGYASTTQCYEVPASIATNTYSGTITLTRGSDSKQATTSLSILPRILSVTPNSTTTGSLVQILGDHFCPSGVCPVSPNRSTGTNNVAFGGGVATIAFVQATSSYPAGLANASKTFKNNVAAGNLIIVGTINGLGDTVTATDTLGDTFTKVLTVTATGDHDTTILVATTSASGADTVMLSDAGSGVYGMSIHEYSGVAISSIANMIDASSSAGSSGSTAPSSGNITTANANDLIFGYVTNGNDASNNDFTDNANFTKRELSSAGTAFCNSGGNCLNSMDWIRAATVTTAATATMSLSDNWAAAIIAFKAGGATNYALDSDFVNQTGGAGACNGAAAAWTDGEICVKVPAASSLGSASTTVTGNSLPSNIFSFNVTSTPGSPPGTPGVPSPSNIGSSTLTESWSGSTGNPTLYTIQRATSSQVFIQTATSTATTTNQSGLSANTTYYYRVQASNANGSSSWSASSSALTLPDKPGTPSYASIGSSTLTVSWTAPTGGATSYKIERATSSQVYAQITTTSSLSIPDSGLSPNTTYYYRVRATNATGDGAYSASSSQLMLPDVPGTPTFASVNTSTLTINWTAPGSGAASYKVERATSSLVFAQIVSTSSLSYPDSGLTASTTYYYRVRATNATGDGAYSGNGSTSTLSSSNAAPNAPSEDFPASGIQDASTSPVLKMTATDPESNALQYKVTLYTTAGCSGVVETDDQSASPSQPGWSGQNASGTPGNYKEYTSGTQGVFTVQSVLTNNATYYWRASAKDPEGSGAWTDSAACNSFTITYGNWTTDSGTWSITGGAYLTVTPASGASVQLHAAALSLTNDVIEFQGKSNTVGAGTGNIAGVIRADSGTNRYHLMVGDFVNQKSAIGKTSGGSYTTLTSVTPSPTFSAGSFAKFRGFISGSTLKSWVGGGNALSTSDGGIAGPGLVGLAASSTSGSAVFTFDDLAVYTTTTVTMASLPGGGCWGIKNFAGTLIATSTGSTIDLSTYSGQIPVDYDAGGSTAGVWTNSGCTGSADASLFIAGSSTLDGIFGGDQFTYTPATSGSPGTGGGSVMATSSVSVNSVGTVSF